MRRRSGRRADVRSFFFRHKTPYLRRPESCAFVAGAPRIAVEGFMHAARLDVRRRRVEERRLRRRRFRHMVIRIVIRTSSTVRTRVKRTTVRLRARGDVLSSLLHNARASRPTGPLLPRRTGGVGEAVHHCPPTRDPLGTEATTRCDGRRRRGGTTTLGRRRTAAARRGLSHLLRGGGVEALLVRLARGARALHRREPLEVLLREHELRRAHGGDRAIERD
jgi:hypothetical protein